MALKIVSPWTDHYRKLEALFEQDPGVRVVYDQDRPEVMLYVDDPVKASVLAELLPETKDFGNVTLAITVIPGDGLARKFGTFDQSTFEIAFDKNPAMAYAKTIMGVGDQPFTFVVFARTVVQYFTDNLGDLHGIRSTLYQDIAKEVFVDLPFVFYNTDVTGGSIGRPLGEWP